MDNDIKIEPNRNWRSENIRKANEARKKKFAERRALAFRDGQELQDAEKFLDQSIQRFEQDSNVGRLKGDFYKVFDAIGGVRGMVNWVKEDKKHRMEYYKLFIGLLKAESNKQVEGQKQQVIVNIVTPEEKKETVIDVRTEE
jgi:hypothetical protein